MPRYEYEHSWACPHCGAAVDWNWLDFEKVVPCPRCQRKVRVAVLPPVTFGAWFSLAAAIVCLVGAASATAGGGPCGLFAVLLFAGGYAAIWLGTNEDAFASDEDRRQWIRDAQRESEAQHRRAMIAQQAAQEQDLARRRRIEDERLARETRLEKHSRTVGGLKELEPREFEEAIALIFRKNGYSAKLTLLGADGGVDVEVEKNGTKAVVQCKRYSGTVGAPVVRELLGVMAKRKVKEGYVVTTGSFTPQARQFAQGTRIQLWDADHLAEVMNNS